MRDMFLKGRNPAPKLTFDQVREIRLELVNYKHGDCKRIAARYGVTPTVISDIKMGNTYQALPQS